MFKPIDASIGGLFIGVAAGIHMLELKRVSGFSGMLRQLVSGPRDSKIAYLVGLLLAGIIMKAILPETAFDPPAPTPRLCTFAWGVLIGIGTTLANGCTSGHGLCGLSRLSWRSLVAVPTFMLAAMVSSILSQVSAASDFAFNPPVTAAFVETKTLHTALVAFGVLSATLGPAIWISRRFRRDSILNLWCGLCAGTGLSIGGMVRPSVVQAGLSPHHIDFTLWVLFIVALATTFIFYRIAHRLGGVKEACAIGSKQAVDRWLVLGALLFGAGWGASGFCPGPLLVAIAASPEAVDPFLCLLGMVIGMHATHEVRSESAVRPFPACAECLFVSQARAERDGIRAGKEDV